MRANNFEDKIREKLKSREIRPSENAWEKLERQLDAQSPKKSTGKIYYFIVSAAAVLVLAFLLLKPDLPEETNQIVIENPKGKEEKEIPEIPEETDFVVMEREEKTEVFEDKTRNTDDQPVVVLPKKQEKVKENFLEKDPEIDDVLTEKARDLASQIQDLDTHSEDELVREVEELLKNAQREIFARKIQSGRVDAAMLLQEVEWELDRTLQEKVFDFLGENFEKVRTALSAKMN